MSIDPKRIVDIVEARLEQHREYLQEYFSAGPVPPGLEPVDDQTFADFVSQMVKQYPPQPLLFPVLDRKGEPVLHQAGEPMLDDLGMQLADPLTGQPKAWLGGEPVQELRVESPWIAMLYMKRRDPDTGRETAQHLVDGAEAIVRRYERIMARTPAAPGGAA